MSREVEKGSGRVGKVGGGELERWERWEGSVLERWERWHGWKDSWAAKLERLEGSDVASWERWGGKGGSEEVARWERCEGSEVARWERWESGEVERWEVTGFIQEWGTHGES